MKTSIKNLFKLPALAAAFGLILAGPATAQTFTTLYSFTSGGNGSSPYAGLILSGNTLYGPAESSSDYSSYGTVFSLSLPPTAPQLAITLSGTNIILTWTNTASTFTLQSTASLGSTAVWAAVPPAPILINGQNTVTYPLSGTRQFYRLSQ